MHHLKRNIAIFIFILIVALIGWFIFGKQIKIPTKNTPPISNLVTFTNNKMSFQYPKEIKVSQQDDTVLLQHEIPYQNTGACDMEGGDILYEMLTDFNVSLRVINTPLVETVKKLSSYIPEENFNGNILKVIPGFINSFEVGAFKGFAIYEGAEGCGRITHYFPISSTTTLVIQKASIQALSGVRGQNIIQEILKVPGAISKEKSDQIFIELLNTLKIK
ncbi:MAG: hypothetical protein ACYCZW_02110 [Minisyncoccota bacterium]